MPRPATNFAGRRIGRLLVLWRVWNPPTENRWSQAHWRCLCACGTLLITTAESLRNGQKSCGCWRRERMAERNRSGETWRARRAS